ncbi:unnamed protein product [Cylicocyclus nassatus]|uniref:Uncharacterized protein n=1 Tax=Cylicocyclus nassatus TaxID=53992 RepID=A0AA36M2K7_CYLNA|nr:unnamed protein product [Cylicocyclus nassatus]
MFFGLLPCVVLSLIFICPSYAADPLTTCYNDWSRCTPQTSFFTGILWKSCHDYCRKCKGREWGECVQVYNKFCSGGYQCHCKGGNIEKSTHPLDLISCALGL